MTAAVANPAGCFGDEFGTRALPVQLRASPTMTVDECAQLAYNSRGERSRITQGYSNLVLDLVSLHTASVVMV